MSAAAAPSTEQILTVAPRPVSNFFASGLRQKVDRLMDILYAGGVNNPMDSIEQLSYLIFLRLLSERDEQAAIIEPEYVRVFSGQWARFAWGNFVTLTGAELFDTLRGAIEKLHELPGLSSVGKELFRNATLKIYDRPTLRAVVQNIDAMDFAAHDGHDLKGDMYEYLLSRIAQSGTNGQFRTPRHIIALIVSLVNPQPGWRIVDPACGTAGFLIAAYTHILREHTRPADLAKGHLDGGLLKQAQWDFLDAQAFSGFDNDANMVKIAILNLYLHQLERAHIEHHNPLTTSLAGTYPGKQFDCILANPPFSGKVQDESILSDLNHKLNTRSTELLFLKWMVDHLASGGRAGVIIPNGVLFAGTGAAKAIRKMLLDDCELQAVITMPAGVFKPYAGVATAILVFQKGGSTNSVWFYEMTADGFSLSDTRTPVEETDIPDIIQKWPSREEGLHSFRVSRSKLAEFDDVLTPGRYREHNAVEAQHSSPVEIIAEIIEAEQLIVKKLHDLQSSLGL